MTSLHLLLSLPLRMAELPKANAPELRKVQHLHRKPHAAFTEAYSMAHAEATRVVPRPTLQAQGQAMWIFDPSWIFVWDASSLVEKDGSDPLMGR